MAAVADADLVADVSHPDPGLIPECILYLGSGPSAEPEHGGRTGELGVGRRHDRGAGNLREPRAEPIGETPDPLLDPRGPDLAVEIDRRAETDQQAEIAGAVLHQPEHRILLVVPLARCERCPELL